MPIDLTEDLAQIPPRMQQGIDRQVASLMWLMSSEASVGQLSHLNRSSIYDPANRPQQDDGSDPTVNIPESALPVHALFSRTVVTDHAQIGSKWLEQMFTPVNLDGDWGSMGTIRTDLDWWPDAAAISKQEATKLADWLRENLRFAWAYLWGFPDAQTWELIFAGTGRVPPNWFGGGPSVDLLSAFAGRLFDALGGLLLLHRYKVPQSWVAEVREMEPRVRAGYFKSRSDTRAMTGWACREGDRAYEGWSGRQTAVRFTAPHAKAGRVELDFFEVLLLAQRLLNCFPVRPQGWLANPKVQTRIRPNTILARTGKGYMVVAPPNGLDAVDFIHPSVVPLAANTRFLSILRLDGSLVGAVTEAEFVSANPLHDRPVAVKRCLGELKPYIGAVGPEDIPLGPVRLLQDAPQVQWTAAGKAYLGDNLQEIAHYKPGGTGPITSMMASSWAKSTLDTYEKLQAWGENLSSAPDFLAESRELWDGQIDPIGIDMDAIETGAATIGKWTAHAGPNFLKARKVNFKTEVTKTVVLPPAHWKPLVEFHEAFQKLLMRWRSYAAWTQTHFPPPSMAHRMSLPEMGETRIRLDGAGVSLTSSHDTDLLIKRSRTSSWALRSLTNIRRDPDRPRRFIASATFVYTGSHTAAAGWLGKLLFDGDFPVWFQRFVQANSAAIYTGNRYIWDSSAAAPLVEYLTAEVRSWHEVVTSSAQEHAALWRARLAEMEAVQQPARVGRSARKVGRALRDPTWRRTLQVLRRVA